MHFGAFLGHLRGILGHLGPRSSKTPPRWLCQCPAFAILANFGVNFGVLILYFFGHFGGHVLDKFLETFRNTFEQIFATIFGTRWAYEGPRWALRGPLRSSKSQQPAFAKTIKKTFFDGFWGSKAIQDSLGRPKKAPKRRLKST